LRRALDFLRDESRDHFATMAHGLLVDPWAARDEYVQVLLEPTARDAFLERHARVPLDPSQRKEVLRLLEMQHQLMLMYTSCGWFFDDLAGLETVQILRYAARALELWPAPSSERVRGKFLEILAEAESNEKAQGTGADIFRARAETARVDPERIAGHLVMSAVVEQPPPAGTIGQHDYELIGLERERQRGATLVSGRIRLVHRRLLTDADLAVAAVHSGGTEFDAFVLHGHFRSDDVSGLLAVLREHATEHYGMEDLLEPRRRELLEAVLRRTIDEGLVVEPESSCPCPVEPAELTLRLESLLREVGGVEGRERIAAADEVRHLVQLGREVGLEFDLEGVQNLFHEEILPGILATKAMSDPDVASALEELALALGFLPSVFSGTDT
jgi:hypothetical protein